MTELFSWLNFSDAFLERHNHRPLELVMITALFIVACCYVPPPPSSPDLETQDGGQDDIFFMKDCDNINKKLPLYNSRRRNRRKTPTTSFSAPKITLQQQQDQQYTRPSVEDSVNISKLFQEYSTEHQHLLRITCIETQLLHLYKLLLSIWNSVVQTQESSSQDKLEQQQQQENDTFDSLRSDASSTPKQSFKLE
jgi:hypothetical protein